MARTAVRDHRELAHSDFNSLRLQLFNDVDRCSSQMFTKRMPCRCILVKKESTAEQITGCIYITYN